jgi:L-ribulose-5-phosphate 3-epimerase
MEAGKVNIGIRAHDFELRPLNDLAAAIREKGLTSVQLALGKSLPYIKTDTGSMSPGFAHQVGQTFARNDIQIAVLGCYINMIHPDLQERKKALDRFKEHIRYARDFGCSIVGTETGNVNADIIYTEENFKEQPFLEVVESVRELVAEAEKFGVIVGIEGGVNHPIYSPKVMKRLLNCIDSNNLQVIYDPVNYLTAGNYHEQAALIQEAFELFGDRIAIVHAKDFIIENDTLTFVPPGKGQLNYELILKYLKANKPFVNILMEDTKEPHIHESVKFLNHVYKNA